jgi:hypothetical protein
MPHETILNVFGAVVIGINMLIWLVARRLVKIDPSYFQTRDGLLRWWDIQSVSQVVRMIFDPQLPDPAHGPWMRKAIYLIRVLYVVGIVGAAFFFYLFFVHPQLIFPG